MGNLITYVEMIGQKSINELPFNEVDNLVLAYLVYYDFRGIVPPPKAEKSITLARAARIYLEKHGRRQFNVNVEVLEKMAVSKRFAGLLLSDFVDVFRKGSAQFAGMRIRFRQGITYLSFRGVDETLTGWQEAFRATYRVTAAQRMATAYVSRLLSKRDKGLRAKEERIYLGGHSKGGNLALHAAASISETLRSRIRKIFLNDSPSLIEEFYDARALQALEGRVMRIVPHYCIVGKLYVGMPVEPDLIVRSHASGVYQHEPMFWEIDEDRFAAMSEYDPQSVRLANAITRWIADDSMRERESFTEEVFRALKKRRDEGMRTDRRIDTMYFVLHTYAGAADASRSAVKKLIGAYIKTMLEKLPRPFRPR